MSKSVVNLTVHKNTLSRRRARNNADLLIQEAKGERAQGDLAGFALVTWDKCGAARTTLHLPAGSPVDLNLVEGYVAGCIRRRVGSIDTGDFLYGQEDPEDGA